MIHEKDMLGEGIKENTKIDNDKKNIKVIKITVKSTVHDEVTKQLEISEVIFEKQVEEQYA